MTNNGYPEECKQFEEHAGQMKFLSSNAQFRACISGVRGGKTRVGCYETLLHLLRYPGITCVIVSPQITMMIRPGGPIEQLKEMIRWWSDYGVYIAHEDTKNHVIKLSNGSRCLFVHCGDEDKLRGFEAACIFIDEAAYISQEAYNILLGRMTQKDFPHRLWIATTPRGHNWVYQQFIENPPDTHEVFLWTTADNPAIGKEFVENLKTTYGENSSFYQQEVLGAFVAFEGLVYHVQKENLVPFEPPLKEFDYIFGAIDWGSTSVFLIGGINNKDKNFYVLNEVYTKDLILYGHPEDNDFYTQVQKYVSHYGVELIWADPEDRNAIRTFQMKGLPLKRAKNSVLPGIREVTAKMPRIKIVEGNCPKLLFEMKNYQWTENTSLMEFRLDSNPKKQFDHACDALRYLVMGLSNIDRKLYGS